MTRYLVCGDAATIPLQSNLVHAVCTSPPYWSLRKYAGEQERDWPEVRYAPMPGLPDLVIEPMRCALGLEPTPEAYTAHLVLVMRDVWRVMREDGVCWLNLGDSYAANKTGNVGSMSTLGGGKTTQLIGSRRPTKQSADVDQGNLLMMPHRVALALAGDGWTVRNDNVWNKVNPMPESVAGTRWERCRVKTKDLDYQRTGSRTNRDRNDTGVACNLPYAKYVPCPGCAKCSPNDGYVLRRGSWRHTRAHEFVFQLTKGMNYWANQEAVREILSSATVERDKTPRGRRQDGGGSDTSLSGIPYTQELGNMQSKSAGRNPRSVFNLASQSYKGAHYAVFPKALIAPLIRAACPTRCCPVCGAGWAAVVEPSAEYAKHLGRDWADYDQDDSEGRGHFPTNDGRSSTRPTKRSAPGLTADYRVKGYRPTCTCNARHVYHTDNSFERCAICDGPCQFTEPAEQGNCYVPGIVFDPFVGSGTTLEVARELGLRAIGLDLAHDYLDGQAKVRASVGAPSNALDDLPMFAEVVSKDDT